VVTTATGHVFVAQTPEQFAYDADGNLTNDGRWAYSWDGENRLAGMETLTNLPSGVPRVRLVFGYDHMGRRAHKEVSQVVSGEWAVVRRHAFTYDGWNLVREVVTADSSTATNVYFWGLDLSGSLQGAGGIGGLLGMTKGTTNLFYAYDANGNVGELLGADGAITAHYEYGPYGQAVVATGEEAANNVFRFSTKHLDGESDLC
jgi:hypothetical protein